MKTLALIISKTGCRSNFGGSQKGGFVPGPQKAERGYKTRNDGTKKRNEGTKNETTVPKTPFLQKLPFLFPFGLVRAVASTYVVCAHWDDRPFFKDRKMSTSIFGHKPEHPQGSGTSRAKISGTSQVPSLETQGKQTFEGGKFRERSSRPPPLCVEDPIPPGSLQAPKTEIFVLT